jgi:sugar lactone lactonase YvrE
MTGTMTVEPVGDLRAAFGEGPVWDPAREDGELPIVTTV